MPISSSRIARGVVAASLAASVACGPSNGVSGLTSDQAPAAAASPFTAPADPQAAQPPAPKPCTDGLFRPATVQNIAPSPDNATVRERAVTFDLGQVQAMPARLNLNLFDDVCDGVNSTCATVYQAPSVECRASMDPCDPAEFCTGSGATCPADTVNSTVAVGNSVRVSHDRVTALSTISWNRKRFSDRPDYH